MNRLGTYKFVASEYYNKKLHPTCFDFSQGSKIILDRAISKYRLIIDKKVNLEVGCGRSLLIDLLRKNKIKSKILMITDITYEMIQHSGTLIEKSNFEFLFLMNAEKMCIESGSIDNVFSILGDPYNNIEFWKEISRILRKFGKIYFITPSFIWAENFRNSHNEEMKNKSLFMTIEYGGLYLNSIILERSAQIELAGKNGLRCVEYDCLTKKELGAHLSPKLDSIQPNESVLDLYVFEKN